MVRIPMLRTSSPAEVRPEYGLMPSAAEADAPTAPTVCDHGEYHFTRTALVVDPNVTLIRRIAPDTWGPVSIEMPRSEAQRIIDLAEELDRTKTALELARAQLDRFRRTGSVRPATGREQIDRWSLEGPTDDQPGWVDVWRQL